jgi:ribosome biogenesis GTPase
MGKGRVKEEHRNRYVLQTEKGELSASVRGKLYLEHSLGESVVPKVGDYVHFEMVDNEQAVITEILPRGNSFVRLSAHDRVPQVIVANVDVGIIVQGLDGDFNVKRLERYLKLVEQSGARPIVVLNKSDMAENIELQVRDVKKVANYVTCYVTNAKSGEGMERLEKALKEGETAVFIGSSGAGKSTITNYLLREEKQETKDVREDDSRGRHTTTSRQLFALPNGAFVIDTPGMRELSLLDDDSGTSIFGDIEDLALRCKFRDCDHDRSAGCAILAAIENGEISQKHFDNFIKLQHEGEHEAAKVDVAAARAEKQKAKQLAKTIKRVKERKRLEGKG